MKITFFSHYYFPEGNAPATRVFNLCSNWAKRGHVVRVITGVPNVPRGKPYAGYKNKWHQQECLDAVVVTRVWTYMAPNRGVVRRTINYLSYMVSALWRFAFTDKPDVVVATSPQFFCAWAGLLASRLKRIPFVLEIRDIWPESISAVSKDTFPSFGVNKVAVRVLEWMEKRMYSSAVQIVTVGEGYKEQLIARGVSPEKIIVIPNGVDIKAFSPTPESTEFRELAGANEGDCLIGYIGTVGMAHSIETLVDAAHLAQLGGLTRFRFVVVGDGARLKHVKAHSEQLGCKNIHFLGLRPKAEMRDWLASLDVCVVHLKNTPLFQSVLPSKMFEAMAMRKPIALGVKGHALSVLEKASAGIPFEPESPEGLLYAIGEIEEKSAQKTEAWVLLQEYVLKHHDLIGLSEEYLDLLQSIVVGK